MNSNSKKVGKSVNTNISGGRKEYLKVIEFATDKFIQSAPASRPGSPSGTRSEDGDHLEYEQVRNMFLKNVKDGEDRLLATMDKVEYSSRQPRRNLEEESKQLVAELEAMKKIWLQNLTIQLDDKILKSNEYIIDIQDSKTIVRIISPKKSS